MHLSVEDGEGLQRVVVRGLQRGHLLGEREGLVLLSRPLQSDGLQHLRGPTWSSK